MSVAIFRLVTPTRSMGLWISTILTGLLLACIVYFWKQKSVPQPKPAE